MYLSKLKIKNYRSIKDLDVDFQLGKNVIVGKNNAGKSNIIKAIDIVLGESVPTYYKYENITENDFYTCKITTEEGREKEQRTNKLEIICVLQRLPDEALNFEEINKCNGFNKYVQNKIYRPQFRIDEYRFDIDDFSNEEIQPLFELDLDCDDSSSSSFVDTYSKQWVGSKTTHKLKFEEELSDKYEFAYVFRAEITEEGIKKDIRFLYREGQNNAWQMAFTAPLRNELLQSAIIPSFRDPNNTLRINQWSWYGKLLRASIDTDHPELVQSFDKLKEASEKVFANLKKDINHSKINVAFPDTEISIQFNPDSKIDVYKQALIYVDDGFKSQLQEKGSGIQSAVIIGLFNYYTKHIAHQASSLLIVEEPEIYLHPQARRVVSDRIDDFLDDNKNQVILTTHSIEFITSAHDSLNIILAKKSKSIGTEATNTNFSSPKEKSILIKKQNTEMFFADKVLLVEGGEKYIIEAVASYYGITKKPFLGPNWLNEKNCSVIEVEGKTEFWKYYNKLQELEIQNFILADFDFFFRSLGDFFTKTSWENENIQKHQELNGELGKIDDSLPEDLLEEIEKLKKFAEDKGFKLDAKKVRREMRKSIRLKKFTDVPGELQGEVKALIKDLRRKNLFLTSGELEDYFTENLKNETNGKHLGKKEIPVFIVSELLEEPSDIIKFIDCDEYIKFLDIVTADIIDPSTINVSKQEEKTTSNVQ